MKEKWNVNVVLCEQCDEDVENIQKIFNKITVRNTTPPFYIVTFINGIGVGNCLELFYCIDKVDTAHPKRAYAGKVKFDRKKEAAHFSDGSEKKGTVENCCIDMFRSRVSELKFPGGGEYELKVYGFTDREEVNEIDNMDWKERRSKFTDDNLFATYPFKIDVIN